jgi:hypothetical protein
MRLLQRVACPHHHHHHHHHPKHTLAHIRKHNHVCNSTRLLEELTLVSAPLAAFLTLCICSAGAQELNSVTDNPLLFFDEATGDLADVISGGNFHGEPLAIALDYLGIAVAEIGSISERRTMRLTDESSNVRELPAFLTRDGGVNSGYGE